MNRLLARTSVIALCAAWSLAANVAHADDAAPPARATDTASNMPTTLEGQIQRAKTLRSEGNLVEAQRSLAQLMLVAPDDARVVGEYGKILTQLNDGKDAIAFLTRAVQLNGADWTLYSALGVAYDQAGNRANARKSYDRALAMKPGEASVLNNYAMSRMLAGDYDGAVQMFTQLQANGAGNPKIAANLARAQELKAVHDTKVPLATAKADIKTPVIAKTLSPVVTANVKSDSSGVVMQQVPVDPLAGPSVKAKTPATLAANEPKATGAATGTPRAWVNTAAVAKTQIVVAAAQPKLDRATTVMQKVPADPQAGPVTKPSKAPSKLTPKKVVEVAKAVPAKTAPKLTPPSLRTVAD